MKTLLCKKILWRLALTLSLGVLLGGAAAYFFPYEWNREIKRKASFLDVSRPKQCGRPYMNLASMPYGGLFQDMMRFALYFDYNDKERHPNIDMNAVMACMDADPKACETKMRRDGKADLFETYKTHYEAVPPLLRPQNLFTYAAAQISGRLEQCGRDKDDISLHYHPTDRIFQRPGTLGIYAQIEIDPQDGTYSLRLYKYRPDKHEFASLRDAGWIYSGETRNKTPKEIESQIRRHFMMGVLR